MSGLPSTVPTGHDGSDYDDGEDVIDVTAPAVDEDFEDWEDSEEQDDEPTPSLFDPTLVLPSPAAAIEHAATKSDFDLRAFIIQASLTDYGVIQVINYIRSHIAKGLDPRPLLASALSTHSAPWASDDYLMPVLPEDPLLCYDFDEWTGQVESISSQQQGLGSQQTQQAGGGSAHDALDVVQLKNENNELKSEVAQLKEALQLLRQTMFAMTGLNEEDEAGPSGSNRPASSATPMHSSQQQSASQQPCTSAGVSTSMQIQQSGKQSLDTSLPGSAAKQIDDSYFDSYSGFNIHREMISDKARTDAYQLALEGNPALMQGKTVLDVGCGTGILSLFACRGGAQTVIAVDGSSFIANFARQIAAEAGFSADKGGPMHVVSSKLEQLTQLPGGVQQVDVIVSEWMGYALLFETMLDSVLTARDRFLKPGGVVLPDMATIFMAGATMSSLGLDFWKDVYGFSMQSIAHEIKTAKQQRANVLSVDPKNIVTNTVTAKVLDMCTMKAEDQDFTSEFLLTLDSTATQATEVAAIVLWFDVDFSTARCPQAPVKLSTSPQSPLTHWAQTVLPLQQPVLLGSQSCAGANTAYATQISGRLSMSRNRRKHRSLDISLEYKATLSDGTQIQHTGIYPMSVLGD